MDANHIAVLCTIVVYLLMVLVIGIYFMKKNTSTDDFYLGGRTLGPFVTAMSAEASDMSSWLLMGLPGVAYLCGLPEAVWTALGLAVGTYVNWLIVAKRIRRYSQKIGAITVPDFFSLRYKDKNNILNFFAAVVIIIFFIPYTASGFAACGKLFSSLFGVEYMTAMIISAIVIVGYTTLGGFLAASTTDFIQSIVMTIAIIVVLGYGINVAGGMDVVIANAQALPGYLDLTKGYNIATGEAASYGFIPIVSTLAWGLGYFGMPHILLRFMAIKDAKKLKLSRRVATVWVVISLFVATAIGIVCLSVSKVDVIPAFTTSGEAETVIVKVAEAISTHGILPAIVAGIILAGILAATMSTADSQLLAASSSVSQNIMNDVFNIKMSQKTQMIVARVTVIIISLIAVLLARDPNSSVFNIVSFAWAGFGAAFGPVVLFALFWKRSNKWGALAAMVSGGALVFIWKYLVRPIGGAWDIYELLPAFIVACVAMVVVSLLTEAPSEDVEKEFEEVKAMRD